MLVAKMAGNSQAEELLSQRGQWMGPGTLLTPGPLLIALIQKTTYRVGGVLEEGREREKEGNGEGPHRECH